MSLGAPAGRGEGHGQLIGDSLFMGNRPPPTQMFRLGTPYKCTSYPFLRPSVLMCALPASPCRLGSVNTALSGLQQICVNWACHHSHSVYAQCILTDAHSMPRVPRLPPLSVCLSCIRLCLGSSCLWFGCSTITTGECHSSLYNRTSRKTGPLAPGKLEPVSIFLIVRTSLTLAPFLFLVFCYFILSPGCHG